MHGILHIYMPIVQKHNIGNIPQKPGIYFLKGGRDTLYVGKAANLRARVRSHFAQPSVRDKMFIGRINAVAFRETGSEIEALILESQTIKKLQPKYNVLWKDDKSYLSVLVESSPSLRVSLIRKPGPGTPRRGTAVIGPFVEGAPLRKTLRLLRRIFPYRTAAIHPPKPCAYCSLGLCPGPDPDPSKAKANARALVAVLRGKKKSVLARLLADMKKAAQNQEYERAAQIRDQMQALERVMENARVLTPLRADSFSWTKAEAQLRRSLGIPGPIVRVEFYDISNIQGALATGSMVVFEQGEPARSAYRKFRIRGMETPNDFAMLQQVLERRLRHREWPLPQLLVVDGGKGQLSAARKALRAMDAEIPCAALAKPGRELFSPSLAEPLPLDRLSPDLRSFLLFMQDEAHRFAISYHRSLRGVGQKKAA